jgi:SAM-dependent methyltransferase
MSEPREHLRATFDEVADAYARARPTCPEALFDDLQRIAGLDAGSAILEIGCGTGQATAPLARRGLDVTCIELGARLAAVARRELMGFPSVKVLHGSFESWAPGDARFDAVAAFTAWHWLDPEVAYSRAAALLQPRGSLAIVDTRHVLTPGGDRFFVDVQEVYERVLGPSGPPPGPPQDVADRSDEIMASGYFDRPRVARHLWDVTYTADEYLAVLGTYSGHQALDARVREELCAGIRALIDPRPGGTVTKTYLGILHVARRL